MKMWLRYKIACRKGIQITSMGIRLIVKNMKFLVIVNFDQVKILLVLFGYIKESFPIYPDQISTIL